MFHKCVGCILVQRIIRVGFQEQEIEPQEHRIQRQNRQPVFSQDIQAHITLQIDIGVVDFLDTLDFRRIDGEVLANLNPKEKLARAVVALSGDDLDVECKKVRWIGKFNFHRGWKLEFCDIFLESYLSGTDFLVDLV